MPAGQAFIDLLANTAVTFDPSLPHPLTVSPNAARAICAPEQAALAARGQSTRRDEGVMALAPLGGGPVQNVPAIVVIGASGPAAGGGGKSAILIEPALAGRVLIAVGGTAVSDPMARANGGGAVCMGAGGDGLVVALGGDGAAGGTTPGPSGNGQDGGDGGQAIAIALNDGAAALSLGGRGQPLSFGGTGVAGIPFRNVIEQFFFRFFGIWAIPPAPAGTDGIDDGDGGHAYTVGANYSRLTAYGGASSPTTFVPPPFPPGAPTGPPSLALDGLAAVHHGVHCSITCKNGDGSQGTVKPRP